MFVTIFWCVAIYLVLHGCLYFVLRSAPLFRTERGIFVFELSSFVFLAGAAFAYGLTSGFSDAITNSVLAAAAHGIYSLSFLELWSLSEGSYSFMVLSEVQSKSRATAGTLIDELSRVGDRKKINRLDSLFRLRLLERDGDRLRLSSRGRIVARGLSLVRWVANLRYTG